MTERPFPVRSQNIRETGGRIAFHSAGRLQWRDRGRFSRPSRSPGQINFHSQSKRRGA